MTAARTTRRLPGFRFEAQPPPLDEVLPRMDVAVFVGFAAAGPLHVPVAVEDAAQFAALFGEDAALAWDARRGETIHAHLGPAVRAFFRNGGRRCWVVRVARRARPNTFPVPGLARLKATGKLAPAFAVARSEGSWSDSLRAAASLLSRSLVVGRFDSLTDFEIELHAGDELAAGDLLRLTFAEGFTPMVVVRSVAPADEGGGGGRPARATVRVRGGEARWFRQPGRAPIVKQGRAHLFTFDGRAKTAAATVAPNSPWGRGQAAPAGKPVALNLALRPADAPAPGSVVRARLGTRWLWLRADEVRVLGGGGAGAVQVSGEAVWLLRNPPTRELTTPPLCEKLLFELRARRGDEDPVGLPDLGFTSAHPRFWGALPTDAAFYRRGAPRADAAREALWREAAGPRFPLAGPGGSAAAGGVYFPVLMPTFPREYAAPRARRESSLRRDGLAGFGSELFLDPALAETGADVLLSRADFIRYQSRRPRPLDGVHAALELEEATIVVVPDAVHLGWEERHESDPHPQASAPLPHPEWWRFLDCAERPQAPAVEEPLRENFLDCGLRVIPAPKLAAGQPDAAGTLALSWSGEPGARFVLEEATLPDWSGAAVIYEGAETQTVVYGRGSGTYFYRVRAEAGGRSSNWSNGVGVRVQASGGWLSKPAAQYRPATLAEVHCALLRVCAARGDLFAVLSLPDHYREDDALGHANLLKPAGPSSAPRTSLIAPLGYGETHALSFGAVYHPWLVSASEGGPGNSLRRSPPDGAAAGVLARRAFARGAWVAPANELLRGVVALDPPLRRTHLAALHEAQVNVVRQEPRGFLALSADTLSEETDYRPIGVRRLLSLLRRMALQLGARYVFEPHDEAFRRLVRRGFEGMLGEMFARGAFAGRSPAESFRVVTDSTLNTNRMTDLGRFVVELKVAPSLPLTFLTIRLVQSGDRGLTATER